MRYELKTIGIWAMLKVSFFMNLVIGFLCGLFYAFFMSLLLAFSSAIPLPELGLDPAEISFTFLFIVMPIFFAVGGAVFLTLFYVFGAALYNLVARVVGGYEFELAPVGPVATTPPVYRPIVAQASLSAQPSPTSPGASPAPPASADSPPHAESPEDRREDQV